LKNNISFMLNWQVGHHNHDCVLHVFRTFER